jgi:hypothetical protein
MSEHACTAVISVGEGIGLGEGLWEEVAVDAAPPHAATARTAMTPRALAACWRVTARIVLEATPRIELGMEVLQTSALPLGYVAAAALDSSVAVAAARLGG